MTSSDGHPDAARSPARLFDLSGEVALVTGGNSGIGRAIALSFAAAGASVAIWGRNEERNASVLTELRAFEAPATAMAVDVVEHGSLRGAVESVRREVGAISILVNNAGLLLAGSVMTVEREAWQRVLATNLLAPFDLCRLVAPEMMERRAGKIINVVSANIAFGNTGASAYAVSKSALAHLTRCLAVELAPYNVQVNAIAPAFTDTDMIASLKGTAAETYGISRTPAGRWAAPEEMAGTALYLASQASSYVTGEIIFVDGGYTSKQ